MAQPSSLPNEDHAATEAVDCRVLLDTAPCGMVLADAEGRLRYANDMACKLFGGGRQQLLARRLATFIWPAGSCRIGSAGSTGGSREEDALLLREDGTFMKVAVMTRIEPGGRCQAWIWGGAPEVIADPHSHLHTAESASDQAMSPPAATLRGIFDLLPVGIWLTDRNGRISGSNLAANRIWKRDQLHEHQHMNDYRGWRADTGEPIPVEDSALARAVVGGATSTGELVRIRCFDGSWRTIIHSAAPLKTAEGQIFGAVVVDEDITELHQAKEEVRAAEQALRTVLELLPVGVWLTDRDGKVTYSNPGVSRIRRGDVQVGSGSYDGLKGWWVQTGEPLAPQDWGVARALRGAKSDSELIRIQCLDGSFKTIVNWAAPLLSDTGEIVGAVAAEEDVTAFHRTQEQLRIAVREREELLAIVAHDLRSPLFAMTSYAATIAGAVATSGGDQSLRKSALALEDLGRRMSGLVSDLLAVAVVESNGLNMVQFSLVEPRGLIEKAADEARAGMTQRGLQLEVDAAQGLRPIRADGDRIARVLANLLDNARKFTPSPGCVVISAKPMPNATLFRVSNTGDPVAASELQAMFQPFWQARPGRDGAGLGLSICRSIVEAHGGTIWAEPAQGQRLRICFVLPRA